MNVETLFPVIGGATAVVGLTLWLRHCLREEVRWDYRQQAHLLILFLPVFIAGLVCWHLLEDGYLDGSHGWLTPSTALLNSVPFWFLIFTAVLNLVGSVGYAARHWYFARQLWGCSRVDTSAARVQLAVDGLARLAKVDPPPVRRLLTRKPLAVVTGFHRPVLYLSSWYFELSEAELASVLAHELAHIARRDNLTAAWATGSLLGCFYWPAGWQAFEQLMQERELAADELAAGLTGKPLRLAKVLIKADEAHRTVEAPVACRFEAQGSIEKRVEQLIYLHQRPLARSVMPFWQTAAVWLTVGFAAVLAADLIPHWLDTLQ
ncbi:MAG: M56 family metallopeptidase [Gemmatimonadaceae bacterium]|nr:M56 family metallopeptidase [Gloeobacterales cyanobacterium ES-bin-141]